MKAFKQLRGARGEATGAINTTDTYYAGELAPATTKITLAFYA